jgi:hypothetical protein
VNFNNVVEHIDKIRSGIFTTEAFQALRQYITLSPSQDYLYEAISNYLEYSPVVDWSISEAFVRFEKDPMVSAATIDSSARRGCPSEKFWTAVEQIAEGEQWDVEEEARVQAILALPLRNGGCGERTRRILADCLSDPSPAMRDTAAIAAQRCCGVPESEIKGSEGDGHLIDKVSDHVRKWLRA